MLDFERKFIDTIETDDWEIETDTGWSDIKQIGKTIEYDEWILRTTKCELICADTHIVFKPIIGEIFSNIEEVFVKNLNVGDNIITKNGIEQVIECYKTDKKSNMFDVEIKDKNHRFWSNDILSHNSMWLGNIAKNTADAGYNVAFITVEMGWRKVIKRLGAMRFKVDADQYAELST
jgi:hypothetical protein